MLKIWEMTKDLIEELMSATCRDVQGYSTGQHDVVFATNVLHATRNMGTTLRHCKALLRSGGLLIANELSAKTEFLTLTFGLTEGWWLFDDADRRIPGSPLLSRQAFTLQIISEPTCACMRTHQSTMLGRIACWLTCWPKAT